MSDEDPQPIKTKKAPKKLSLDKVANFISKAGNTLGSVYVDRKTKACKYLEFKSPKGISFFVRIPDNIEIKEPTSKIYKVISMKEVISIPKVLESRYKLYPDVV